MKPSAKDTANNAIVIRPAAPVWQLKDLLDLVTESNRHPSFDWGAPIGKEIGKIEE